MKIEDLLMYQTDVLVVPAGDTVFSEGEPGDSMYVVVSGTAEISVRGKRVETAKTGTIFGEMALIDNSPRSATVVAVEDCSLIAINATRFSALTREAPDFALHVMRAMADRLRNAGRQL